MISGMVFQSFNLFSHLSVMENLMLGPVELRLTYGGAPFDPMEGAEDDLSLRILRSRLGSHRHKYDGGRNRLQLVLK